MLPNRASHKSFRAHLPLVSAAGALLLLGTMAVQAQPTDNPIDTTGVLDVIVKDDFDHGRFETDYFLREKGGEWHQLHFERTPPGHLKTGEQVHIRGQARGRGLWVESLSEDQGAAPATGAGQSLSTDQSALPATNERHAVVLMVDLTNAKSSTRYTLQGIAGQLYFNDPSVDALYRAASFGQVGFDPDTDGNGAADVFGPFTIPYDNSTCDYYNWAYAAESAAQSAGIDLSLYQNRIFVLPRYSDLPACSWAGISNVGCGAFCRTWIAEAESGMVFAHELGHTLGMAHAGTDPENDGVMNVEYGDYSDPMGLSRSWHVFNASHVDEMGWYTGLPDAIATIVASGTYDIADLERDPSSSYAPEMLKISKPDTNEFYYLSYRQPAGYDATLSSTYTSGVNVHRYRGSGYAYTYYIKTLGDGGTFVDAANNNRHPDRSRKRLRHGPSGLRQWGFGLHERDTASDAFAGQRRGTPTVGYTELHGLRQQPRRISVRSNDLHTGLQRHTFSVAARIADLGGRSDGFGHIAGEPVPATAATLWRWTQPTRTVSTRAIATRVSALPP